MIVRTSSHRATSKMKRIQPDVVSLYYKPSLYSAFYEVSDEQADAILAITGITRVRDQDRANYARTWGGEQ